MKEEVLSLFPEINEIQDDSLRDKVVSVWEEALEAGGWTTKDLEVMPFTLLVKGVNINMVEHVRSVTAICVRAAEALEEIYGSKLVLNRDYLIAGANLHDIGKLVEYARGGEGFVKSTMGTYLRHPFSGVGIGYKAGLPEEILHMIAVHSKEGDPFPRSPEAVIINHADFMCFDSIRAQSSFGK
jgi:putative nucleotidyltransferase with HDIG domain